VSINECLDEENNEIKLVEVVVSIKMCCDETWRNMTKHGRNTTNFDKHQLLHTLVIITHPQHGNHPEIPSGWGDTNTHQAFAMLIGMDLVILQANSRGTHVLTVDYAAIPGQRTPTSLYGAYVNNNHFVLVRFLPPPQ